MKHIKTLSYFFLNFVSVDFGVFCLQRHACFVVIVFAVLLHCVVERLTQRTYARPQQLCLDVIIRYVAMY